MGHQHEPGLPFASSLCGACAEVCPVKIDIPKVLLDLREDVVKMQTEDNSNQLERLAFKMFAFAMARPALYRWAGKIAATFGPKEAWVSHAPGLEMLPPVKNWLSQRDLASPAKKSFRDLWKERKG
jgi:L-lactate dehydrogenase complex protein LldF